MLRGMSGVIMAGWRHVMLACWHLGHGSMLYKHQSWGSEYFCIECRDGIFVRREVGEPAGGQRGDWLQRRHGCAVPCCAGPFLPHLQHSPGIGLHQTVIARHLLVLFSQSNLTVQCSAASHAVPLGHSRRRLGPCTNCFQCDKGKYLIAGDCDCFGGACALASPALCPVCVLRHMLRGCRLLHRLWSKVCVRPGLGAGRALSCWLVVGEDALRCLQLCALLAVKRTCTLPKKSTLDFQKAAVARVANLTN